MFRVSDVIAHVLYEKCVERNLQTSSIAMINIQNKLFANFLSGRYATDVCFQQSLRPTGTIKEAQLYYFSKHKLHGYKFERSLLPNGLAISCTKHARGDRKYLEIFQCNKSFHLLALEKKEDVSDTDEDGGEEEQFNNVRALTGEKGYQGIKEFLNAVNPIKKPVDSPLKFLEERFNKRVASDWIILENFFGRLMGLWTVHSNKRRWAKGNYDNLLFICISLTNCHIRFNPLRSEDGDFYTKYKNQLVDIGKNHIEKRREVQPAYRAKRQRHLNIRFCALDMEDQLSP